MRSKSFYLLVILLTNFWCWKNAYSESSKLKIGVILPLTGAASDFGTAVKNAALWGAEEEDQAHQSIEWKIEDVPLSAISAVTSFHKLVSVDKVDAVYVWGAPLCSALAELAEQRKIPVFAQCVLGSIGKGKTYFIRFMNSASDYVEGLTKVLKQKSLLNVSIVTSDNPYDAELTDAFTKSFAQIIPEGKIISLDRLGATEQEFRPIISRLRNYKPDAVLAFLGTGRLGIFLKQYRQQQVPFPAFVGNSAESLSERKAAAGAFIGTHFVNPPVEEEFVRQYVEKFGVENQMSFAAVAYEFGRMTKEVVKQCPTCRGMDLIQKYKQLSPWKGKATGDANFVESSEVGSTWRYPVVLKEIRSDAEKELGRVVEIAEVN